MKFLNVFDLLSDGTITLRLIERNPGGKELPYYYYDILDASGSVGKISIRIGNNTNAYYNGHIGYEIDEAHRGNHYALRACQLVLPVAKAHDMNHLFLTCQESNTASRKTIVQLGATLLEIADIPKKCFFWRPDIEKYCIYRLDFG